MLSKHFLSIVRKMAQYMGDILEPEDKERLQENLLVGPAKVVSNTINAWSG